MEVDSAPTDAGSAFERSEALLPLPADPPSDDGEMAYTPPGSPELVATDNLQAPASPPTLPFVDAQERPAFLPTSSHVGSAQVRRPSALGRRDALEASSEAEAALTHPRAPAPGWIAVSSPPSGDFPVGEASGEGPVVVGTPPPVLPDANPVEPELADWDDEPPRGLEFDQVAEVRDDEDSLPDFEALEEELARGENMF